MNVDEILQRRAGGGRDQLIPLLQELQERDGHLSREAVLAALRLALKIVPGRPTRAGRFSLEVVACIGACGLAPVISVAGEFHAGVAAAQVPKILRAYRERAAREDAAREDAGRGASRLAAVAAAAEERPA